ncbi:MAG: hypothetical protein ABL909_06675 [Sphingopyxis sp.]
MKFVKKAVVAASVISMAVAPVAASAAQPQFDGVRADTEVDGAAFGGAAGGSWLLLLLAGAAIVAGIAVAANGSNNNPTSP